MCTYMHVSIFRCNAILTENGGQSMAIQTEPIATAVEPQSDTLKHTIPALDGVRALACLGVVSFHMNMWAYIGHIWTPWPGDLGAILSGLPFVGEMGFLLFFILSGFLLFLPYAR